MFISGNVSRYIRLGKAEFEYNFFIIPIAAGVIYGGFIAPGHDCGDTASIKFKNNVAHSIDGTGAFIFPDPASSSSSTCYEGSYFAAYKNTDTPLTTEYTSSEVRMRNMVFIDSHKGVSLQTSTGESNPTIIMSDSEIFGEGENDDCPRGQPCLC